MCGDDDAVESPDISYHIKSSILWPTAFWYQEIEMLVLLKRLCNQPR